MSTPKLLKTKLIAAGIHFSISFVVFLVMTIWFCLSLYPSFYFRMSGGFQGLCLMLFCDVVLGPFLTFVVFNYKKAKKEIFTDLSVIALVQLAAFIYGFYTVYQGRPYLTIVYDTGNATVLPYRDVKEDFDQYLSNLSKEEIAKFSKVKGVAIATMKNYKFSQFGETSLDFFEKTDKSTRNAIAQKHEVQNKLNELEQKYGKLICITFLGKYTGAYVLFDQKLNFIASIGEETLGY